MSGKERVLYNKDTLNTEEIWDDEALIKMYDKTTAMIKEKISKGNRPSSSVSKSLDYKDQSACSGQRMWKVGDHCMAIYEEDENYYPAKIVNVDETNNKYEVMYMGYNENAVVRFDQLFRDDEVEWTNEHGDEGLAEKDVDLDAEKDSSINNIDNLPNLGLCPPPPPAIFEKIAPAKSNREALTNMLMSWYMSGYHTGYYQGSVNMKK